MSLKKELIVEMVEVSFLVGAQVLEVGFLRGVEEEVEDSLDPLPVTTVKVKGI